MRLTFGTGLFTYLAILIGYCYAYFIRGYLHFFERPSGDIIISVVLLIGASLAFHKFLKKNAQLKYVVMLLIPMGLLSLQGFFWFYAQTDFFLVFNYLSLVFLGFIVAASFKFPITEKRFKIHYFIFALFAFVGFIISFFSKEFDLAGTLILFVAVSFAVREWEVRKGLSLITVMMSLALLVLSFKLPQPKFSERQNRYEDLVVLSKETRFQTIDVTTWKGNYWYYQNGINHFSSIDSWLYYEPFAYPALTQIMPNRTLIIGGENGMLAAELLKQGLKVDLLAVDSEMVQFAKDEALFTSVNEGALSSPDLTIINSDPFTFLGSKANHYDLIYIDAPDPVDVLTNQFYTKEFYDLVNGSLTYEGVFVTQSGSPYFATQAYEMIKRTIKSSGFQISSYHNQVLTLGEWSWTIGAKKRGLKSELLSAKFDTYKTKWLNNEAMQMMLSFGKTKALMDTSVNTIADPKLYQYYLDGNFGMK